MLEQWVTVNLSHLHTLLMLLIMMEIASQIFLVQKKTIGSIANYLSVHGWNEEVEIVFDIGHNNVRKPYSLNGKFIPIKLEEGNDIFIRYKAEILYLK